MFIPLTSAERTLIKADFVAMVSGEGSLITIKYRTPLIAGAQPDIDPVYKNDRRITDAQEQTANAKCFMQIIHERNLKILGFGIVQAGDAIFYFLDTLNLQEPIAGKPALPNSVYFLDPQQGAWSPITKNIGPLRNYLAMELGNDAISQVVPCSLRK